MTKKLRIVQNVLLSCLQKISIYSISIGVFEKDTFLTSCCNKQLFECTLTLLLFFIDRFYIIFNVFDFSFLNITDFGLVYSEIRHKAKTLNN